MKKYILIPLFGMLAMVQIWAQSPLGKTPPSEIEIFEYFLSKHYQPLIKLLSSKEQLTNDEEILLALSYLNAGEDNSKEIEQWIQQNESHPLQSLAKFSYAEHSFYENDTTTALKLLDEVQPHELSKEDRADYGFIYGVIKMSAKEYQSALDLFTFALENDYPDTDQITYYQAFIHYHLGNFPMALDGFNQVKEISYYASSASFFIAKIQLDQGNIDGVITLAQAELSEEVSVTNSGFHQLIGEAYAKMGDAFKADAYFSQAIKIHPGRPGAALFYQAGVSKFKLGNTDKALNYLTEAGIGSGPYAKLSALQLGRLHVKRNSLEEALTAYIEASSSEDLAIKEESLYYAAGLSAKLERYTDALNFARDYTTLFPNGKWYSDIQNLIAETYLKTSNYDLAIQHLAEIRTLTQVQKSVYQKVALQKANLTFNDGSLNEAIGWYMKSLQYPENKELANEAYLQLGEIYLSLGDHENALKNYQKELPISLKGKYGIGYIYYNLQKYAEALPYFKDAAKSTEEFKGDAKLRSADCLYAIKNYQDALQIYSSLPSTSYVSFQKGLVLWALDRIDDAIKSFREVSPSSNLKSKALLYEGSLLAEKSEFSESESIFSNFISTRTNSDLLPSVYLNRALVRRNQQKLELAKEDFEYVVKKFIATEEAFDAILGLQELQQRGVKVGNLDQYIEDYKRANPNNNSLEVVEFESAKGMYFDLKYDEASIKLTRFLNDYPNTKYREEAEFYLGDSYYRSGNLEQARNLFNKLKQVVNAFSSRVLTRLGNIDLELKNYSESVEAFNMLLALNISPNDNYNAKSGSTLAYFEQGQYDMVVELADDIINDEWKPINGEKIARMTKARALVNMGKMGDAISEYKRLADGLDGFAAEANYQLALYEYRNEEYDSSLEALFNLVSKYGSYIEWVDKSYLLIADNYISKEELFQAKATLRSIIQHTKDETIRATALSKLTQIEQFNETDTLKTQN